MVALRPLAARGRTAQPACTDRSDIKLSPSRSWSNRRMSVWSYIERDSTRLALADFGGSGPSILLLHGLAGHAEEWSDTVSWLKTDHHVFALDLRGHGRSERRPQEVSMSELVADAIAAIQRIDEPVILVGQSLGGLISIAVAAVQPGLVRALVVVEASPAGVDEAAGATLVAEVERQLSSWPVPFRTRDEAVDYFGGSSVSATAWAVGLEERDNGLWPRFDIDVMLRMLNENVGEERWNAWNQLRCPVLIVRGENGSLAASDAEEMIRRLPSARFVTVREAGHDVHLEQPEGWRGALSSFLDQVSRSG